MTEQPKEPTGWTQKPPPPLSPQGAVAVAPDTVICGYMGFDKFVSLLATRSIYFCRIDRLEDRYEGRIHDADRATLASPSFGPFPSNFASRYEGTIRQRVYVNCWCRSEIESVAMWKVYLSQQPGVAVKSTAGQLARCIIWSDPAFVGGVRIHKVLYYPHVEPVPDVTTILPFLKKRRYFEYENEARAVIVAGKDVDPRPGVSVSVDLDVLVNEIRVEGTSPEWFLETVKAVTGQFGIKKPVNRSDID